jgi:hypothetical protein
VWIVLCNALGVVILLIVQRVFKVVTMLLLNEVAYWCVSVSVVTHAMPLALIVNIIYYNTVLLACQPFLEGKMERVARIELASLAWKAKVLPLHNTRGNRR